MVTTKLICAFVFAYAKSRFSHDEAQIFIVITYEIYLLFCVNCIFLVAEKGMVMEMIHTAMASQQDYYQRDYQPAEFIENDKITKLPPINEKKDDGPKLINR